MNNLIYVGICAIPVICLIIKFFPVIKGFVQQFKYIGKTFMEPDPVSKRIKEEQEKKKREAKEVEFTDVSD